MLNLKIIIGRTRPGGPLPPAITRRTASEGAH
jgi:hypothetical protein